MILVKTEQHFGITVSQVIDETVVQTAETVVRVQSDVRDIKPADSLGDGIASPFDAGLAHISWVIDA